MMKKILILFLILLVSFSQPCFSSIDFQNSDDSLTCGTATDILMYNSAGSTTAWIYMDSLGPSNLGRIISKQNGSNVGLSFAVNTCGGSGQTLFFSVSGSTGLSKIASALMNLNQWHHVAYTWDGTTNSSGVKLYIDGVEASSYCSSANGASLTDNSAGTIRIGNRGALDRGFDGRISEVKTYNRELSATEILQSYHKLKRKLDHAPKAYWDLNELAHGETADGKTFPDYTGNGHTCTGDDGAGNTGLIADAEEILSYPD